MFALGDRLYFCEREYRPPHGVIDLSLCLAVKSAEDKTRENCFQVSTKSDRYYLSAGNPEEKDEWIGRIGKAIVTSSSSYRTSDLTDSQ